GGSGRRRSKPCAVRTAGLGKCHRVGWWLVLRGGARRKETVMRVFVMGATGALGRFLVPGLVAAGHEVTAATRAAGKVARLRGAGAGAVGGDGLGRGAVGGGGGGGAAGGVRGGAGVRVHEVPGRGGLRGLRNRDRAFGVPSGLRTGGTDNGLAGAARAGTRRVIAQGYAGPGPDKPSSGGLKTEDDPPG